MTVNKISALLQRDQAAIMGIINATPDSFSDGGLFDSVERAIEHGLQLAAEGADILDIGGESTRPGADSVPLQMELDRVIPVIEGLSQNIELPISIDTTKAEVMRAAVSAGAEMINDINALQADGALEASADCGVPVCLMHMQGKPRTMQHAPQYHNVVIEVTEFLQQRTEHCLQAGIEADNIVLDPGIGFGKTVRHNLQLLNNLPQMVQQLGKPLLIGASRKSLIDAVLVRGVEQRSAASVGLAVQAVLNGAKIVRVHDVAASSDAIRMVEAVRDV